MADANANNFRYLNHFFEVNRAQSVNRLIAILHAYEGIPWVNTIAVDSTGKALYADISVTPHVTDAQSLQCTDNPLGIALKETLRLPILDGSTSACAWGSDRDSVVPGIFGAREMPELDSSRLPARADYVTNSNDSYWLSNPEHPLTGFPSIIGDEGTTRSLRTRLGLRIVQQRLDGSDGLTGRKGFTRQQLQDAVFNDRQYGGELLRDGLVNVCRAHQDQPVPTSSGPVTVPKAACDALAAWDLHDNLSSRGALLFRRFISHALQAPTSPAGTGVPVYPPSTPPNQAPGAGLFSTPFAASDPVNTPRGLQEQSPAVLTSLGDAVHDLQTSGIAFDAPLGQYQYVTRNGTRIPIHGGPGVLGDFNAMNNSFVPGKGYPDVPHGSSYVQVVHLDGRACPDARTILTYSQSTDPTSPWFSDQTRMYSAKEWNAPPFCLSQVQAQKISSIQLGQ
jgi:acyl-homoserine-lactone acylase